MISIPVTCSSLCGSLSTGFLPPTCMACLMTNGAIPSYRVPGAPPCTSGDPAEFVWECRHILAEMAAANKSSITPPKLARLPLFEAGLANLPAVPMLFPWRWNPGTTFAYREWRVAVAQLVHNFAYLPKNVKVCSQDLPKQCGRLDMASLPSPTLPCTQKQGWLSLLGAYSSPCPGAAFDTQKANISLEDPRLVSQ